MSCAVTGQQRPALTGLASRIVLLSTRRESDLSTVQCRPPFLKFVLDYKADIGKAVNDDRRRKPRQTA